MFCPNLKLVAKYSQAPSNLRNQLADSGGILRPGPWDAESESRINLRTFLCQFVLVISVVVELFVVSNFPPHLLGVKLSKVWNCPRIVCGSVLPFTINMDWILEIVLWFSLLSWWSCCSRMKKRTNWKMRPLPLKSQPAWQATKCWNQDWDTDLKYLRQSNFVLNDQNIKQALSHKSIWNASVGMRSSFYQKFWEGTH